MTSFTVPVQTVKSANAEYEPRITNPIGSHEFCLVRPGWGRLYHPKGVSPTLVPPATDGVEVVWKNYGTVCEFTCPPRLALRYWTMCRKPTIFSSGKPATNMIAKTWQMICEWAAPRCQQLASSDYSIWEDEPATAEVVEQPAVTAEPAAQPEIPGLQPTYRPPVVNSLREQATALGIKFGPKIQDATLLRRIDRRLYELGVTTVGDALRILNQESAA